MPMQGLAGRPGRYVTLSLTGSTQLSWRHHAGCWPVRCISVLEAPWGLQFGFCAAELQTLRTEPSRVTCLLSCCSDDRIPAREGLRPALAKQDKGLLGAQWPSSTDEPAAEA